MEPISIILALAGLAVGGVLTFIVTRKNNNGIVAAAEEKAQAIIKEAQAKGAKFIEAPARSFMESRSHSSHTTPEVERVVRASPGPRRFRRQPREGERDTLAGQDR